MLPVSNELAVVSHDALKSGNRRSDRQRSRRALGRLENDFKRRAFKFRRIRQDSLVAGLLDQAVGGRKSVDDWFRREWQKGRRRTHLSDHLLEKKSLCRSASPRVPRADFGVSPKSSFASNDLPSSSPAGRRAGQAGRPRPPIQRTPRDEQPHPCSAMSRNPPTFGGLRKRLAFNLRTSR